MRRAHFPSTFVLLIPALLFPVPATQAATPSFHWLDQRFTALDSLEALPESGRVLLVANDALTEVDSASSLCQTDPRGQVTDPVP